MLMHELGLGGRTKNRKLISSSCPHLLTLYWCRFCCSIHHMNCTPRVCLWLCGRLSVVLYSPLTSSLGGKQGSRQLLGIFTAKQKVLSVKNIRNKGDFHLETMCCLF